MENEPMDISEEETQPSQISTIPLTEEPVFRPSGNPANLMDPIEYHQMGAITDLSSCSFFIGNPSVENFLANVQNLRFATAAIVPKPILKYNNQGQNPTANNNTTVSSSNHNTTTPTTAQNKTTAKSRTAANSKSAARNQIVKSASGTPSVKLVTALKQSLKPPTSTEGYGRNAFINFMMDFRRQYLGVPGREKYRIGGRVWRSLTIEQKRLYSLPPPPLEPREGKHGDPLSSDDESPRKRGRLRKRQEGDESEAEPLDKAGCPKIQCTTKSKPRSRSRSRVRSKPRSKPRSALKNRCKVSSKSRSKPRSKSRSKPRSKSRSKPRSKPRSKARSKPRSKAGKAKRRQLGSRKAKCNTLVSRKKKTQKQIRRQRKNKPRLVLKRRSPVPKLKKMLRNGCKRKPIKKRTTKKRC